MGIEVWDCLSYFTLFCIDEYFNHCHLFIKLKVILKILSKFSLNEVIFKYTVMKRLPR